MVKFYLEFAKKLFLTFNLTGYDISISRKTGHFYFVLTRKIKTRIAKPDFSHYFRLFTVPGDTWCLRFLANRHQVSLRPYFDKKTEIFSRLLSFAIRVYLKFDSIFLM